MKLQNKLLLSVIPLSFVSGLLITQLSKNMVRKIVLDDVRRTGTVRAADLATQVSPGVHGKNESMIPPLLASFMEQTSALYAMVLDPEGRVIAHTNITEKGKIYSDDLTLKALRSASTLSRQAVIQGESVMDVAVPITDTQTQGNDDVFLGDAGKTDARAQTRIGTLRIGIPLKEYMRTASQIARRIGLIIIVVGGILLAVILLLIR